MPQSEITNALTKILNFRRKKMEKANKGKKMHAFLKLMVKPRR